MTTGRPLWRVALAHLVYNLLLHMACLMAVAPWLVRVARDRRQWSWTLCRLGRLPPGRPQGQTIWVHAVSVGEVKASRTLIAALQRQAGDATVVLSTGTITGQDTAHQLFPELYVFAWPLDFPLVTASVLRRMNPRQVVMVELEVWPSFSRQADRAGVPQIIVNGRVSQSSYGTYRRFCWWLPEFDRLTLVAAQTDEYAARIADLGVPRSRIEVTGNLKHDLTQPASREEVAGLAEELAFRTDLPVFVAGSTHDGEDEPVIDAWLAAGGAATSQLVIVPRHLDRLKDIGRLLRRKELTWVARSACPCPREQGAVLLVDTMGELEALFGLADVVFLGGSLVPVGGHNVLEPAAASCPVLTGPWVETCRFEADALEPAEGLEVVQNGAALGVALERLLANPKLAKRRGAAARKVAESLAGATDRTMALLNRLDLATGTLLDPPAQ
ncbi:MAG: 3-deoxy-D-manno-octulosonic-acid transferase [Pseudohongiellaceae bacterium]